MIIKFSLKKSGVRLFKQSLFKIFEKNLIFIKITGKIDFDSLKRKKIESFDKLMLDPIHV